MCDSNKNHHHGLIETWVTPKESTRLRSKLVQLAPGESMPAHTTGPGREEVITCIFGTLEVMTQRAGELAAAHATLTAGEAIFIGEDTLHEITNATEDHALYAFVVSMSDEQRTAQRMDAALDHAWA